MGPTEQSAISPKESSPARLSLRIDETPTPSAIIKGTVMGPVVTPPESNATARKSRGTKAARAKTTMYARMSISLRDIPKNIRSSAAMRNSPTPAATAIMRTAFGIDGT